MSEVNYSTLEEDIKALNPDEVVFLAEYTKSGFNLAKTCRMMSISQIEGYRYLNEKKAIGEVINFQLQQKLVDANSVLARLAEHITADIENILDDNGYLDYNKALESGKTHLIKSIQDTKHGRKIVLHDPHRAAALYLKALGLIKKSSQTVINVDYATLNEEQLQDIASGKSVNDVLGL